MHARRRVGYDEGMEYLELSIRVTLPSYLRDPIHSVKERFATAYGSKYLSAPHITLYLARYTREGVEGLATDLESFSFPQFSFTILEPQRSTQQGRYFYALGVSDKQHLEALHTHVTAIASHYQSPLLRKSDEERLAQGISVTPRHFDPHITIGAIAIDRPQPDLTELRQELAPIVGQRVPVTSITSYFYEGTVPGTALRECKKVVTPLSFS